MVLSLFILLILISGSFVAQSQDIPENRLVDWSSAGVTTDIPDFPRVINIADFGGVADGVTSNNAAFTAAMAAATPGTVILFPAGTYFFNNSITLSLDSVVIRGVGRNTELKFNLGGLQRNMIVSTGTEINTDYWLSSPVTKGDKHIVVGNSASISPGQWVRLIANDSSLVTSTWAYKSVGQVVQVERKSGDTLFLKSAIRISWPLSSGPRVRVVNPKKYVGIENLYIERVDKISGATGGEGINILFTRCVNSWVLGVESNLTNFAHISARYSSNITIRGCYLHHAHDYGDGGRAYGMVMEFVTGECLIENNIYNNLRHSVLHQAGVNGNVVAYNYSINPNWVSFPLPANSAGDLVYHGNYPFSNLAEGNAVQHIVIDNSHDKNGPYNTIFRNEAQGYGIFMNTGAGNDQHFVGNDIPNNNALQGAYTLTGSGHFQYGNRRKGANNVLPAGTTNLTRKSYYLCNAPAWWSAVAYGWPNIGIPYTYNATEIPAETRWKGGAQSAYFHPDLRKNNKGVPVLWYADADNDGYGNAAVSLTSCEQPSGYVSNGQDCDDSNNTIKPNTVWYQDVDKDGYHSGNTLTQCQQPAGYVLLSALVNLQIDCKDNDASIHPGAKEVCDGKDNNCNNLIDDADPELDQSSASTWYRDNDGDGFGNPSTSVKACNQPSGYVSNSQDCDDSNNAIKPNTVWYQDVDKDGYHSGSTLTQCQQPAGYVLLSALVNLQIDCKDNDVSVHPGAKEVCDGKDNNCNNLVDDADPGLDQSSASTWYRDSDGDGFGNPSTSVKTCNQPSGYVSNSQDCDDSKNAINPGTVWYQDADKDGYYSGNTLTQCQQPSGYVLLANLINLEEDCDDNNVNIYPGADEIPNDGIDQDCNGQDLITTDINDLKAISAILYPNPNAGTATLNLNVQKQERYVLSIMDISGRILSQQIMPLSPGNIQLPIEVGQPGWYLIQLEGQSDKLILKMIVQ